MFKKCSSIIGGNLAPLVEMARAMVCLAMFSRKCLAENTVVVLLYKQLPFGLTFL